MKAATLAVFVLLAQGFQQQFTVDLKALATQGENQYFILKPGYQSTFQGKGGKLVITVLNDIVNVGGVDTRVVEEREWNGKGEIVEVSRNFFAIDPKTADVYYFGEDVDGYNHGKVANHDGSWRHGSKGATFGLFMPGRPAVGMKFYQEVAKGVAMDRAEIASLTDTIATRAGAFERCLRTRETTPLEPLARETKIYAPGVGLVKDGDLELVSHEYVR